MGNSSASHYSTATVSLLYCRLLDMRMTSNLGTPPTLLYSSSMTLSMPPRRVEWPRQRLLLPESLRRVG